MLTLGFDIGATKTAWSVVDQDGQVSKSGRFPTPRQKDELLAKLGKIISAEDVVGVGIGIAGTTSPDHQDIVVCPHVPDLSHFEIVDAIKTDHNLPVIIDNDARCALIGEAWQGAARETDNCVLITLGTGVGGAVLQNGIVLPHPHDISKEIGYIVADPTDLLPARTGPGSIESLLGGQNLANRFGIPMEQLVANVKAEQPDALAFIQTVQHFFLQVIRILHEHFECQLILVGGAGSQNLDLYLGTNDMPCLVQVTKLGEAAGTIGAARLSWDLRDQEQLELQEATSTAKE